MVYIEGYQYIQMISEDSRFRLWRALPIGGNSHNSVLIKIIKGNNNVAQAEHAELLREYTITKRLQITGVPQVISMEKQGSVHALLLEDDGSSISLREYIDTRVFITLEEFLSAARAIASLVAGIHRKGVIHLDLRPAAVLIHPLTLAIGLTGFGKAQSHEFESYNRSAVTEDGIPYSSPEQTGRLQRNTDERSDLYSLGVILYEMLTGHMPYEAKDSLEWIHAHLAQVPQPISNVHMEIPEAVVLIVMKLLEKNAEARYANAEALIVDIDKCKEYYAPLLIKDRLIGRNQEVTSLAQAFQSVCYGSSEIVYVSGDTGIGKTSLVEEVFQSQKHPVSPFYITGKFEQISKESPYHPIIQAFRGLMRHLLGGSLEQVEVWKSKFQRALGSNEAVMAAIIPELSLLTGARGFVEELPPEAAKNRFTYAFRRFVQVLCSKQQPLVLFIDDLQWADASSLQLIHSLLCDPESQYFMFVGAYRDMDTERGRLPGYAENGTVASEVNVRHIHLQALSLEQTNQIVKETLNEDAELTTLPLAEVLYHQSGGNPFQFKQLFQNLQAERFLSYSRVDECWTWSLSQIIEKEALYAVSELMKNKLGRLSGPARELLQFAACVGSAFQLAFLADVAELKVDEAEEYLTKIVEEGLIIRLAADTFGFLHDNIQQITYDLIEEDDRTVKHLRIGRKMKIDNYVQPEHLFDAVNHLNIGGMLITDNSELLELIELNLAAGKQAKATSAYDIALIYYRKGTDLLTRAEWESHFALSFEISVERSECEYLCGYFDIAAALFESLMSRARNPMERARVQMIRIAQYINLGKYADATSLGLQSLKEFRISISPDIGMKSLVVEVIRTNWVLRHPFERLFELPEMTDEDQIVAMNLIFSIVASTFFTNKKVYFMLMCKAIQISIKHGNTQTTAAAYAAYGMILGNVLGKYDKGYAIAKVGVELSERSDAISVKSKTHTIFGGVLCQFVGPSSQGDAYLVQALRFGLESGDYIFSSYAIGAHVNSLYTRVSLPVLSRTIEEYMEVLAETKDEFVLQNFYLYRQHILALQGKTADPLSLDGEEFEEELFLQHIHKEETSATTLFQYNTYKTQICYVLGRYEEAILWFQRAKPFIPYATHLPHLPECCFYDALALLAVYRRSPQARQPLKVVKIHLQRFKQWVKWSPDNFLAKLLLLEAEMAYATKHYSTAEEKYDRAIREAREQDNIQMESVACELAASYYLDRGKDLSALSYLQSAYVGYTKWGLVLKTKQLEEKFPQLRMETLSPVAVKNLDEDGSRGSIDFRLPRPLVQLEMDRVDLGAILRASQALLNRVNLGAVLTEIVEVMLKYAGAQKGCLLMVNNAELNIQVYADAEVLLMKEPTPLTNSDLLPEGIARYVARTQEPVYSVGAEYSWVIHNPYILTNHPESFVCLPIIVQGTLIGVLYLENALTSGVFTSERMEVVHSMAAQCCYICGLRNSLGYSGGEDAEEDTSGMSENPLLDPLTDRELEVLALMATGMSNKEIADQLVVAIGTVKVHVKNIFFKLKVNRRMKAVAQAKELQLLE